MWAYLTINYKDSYVGLFDIKPIQIAMCAYLTFNL